MASSNVMIIGGGIQGRFAAYYLIKEGYQVSIIDPRTNEEGASFVNAGYLTPSHIISIANKGMIKKGIKWMFNSSSPFYLKPRLERDFIDWLWKFYQSSTPTKVEKAIPVIEDINLLSKELFQDIHDGDELGDFQLDHRGILMLYKTAAAEAGETKVAQRVQADGMEVDFLDRGQLNEIQSVSPDVMGAIHYKCDAHTTPPELMGKLKSFLESKGVNFIEESVLDFKTQGNKIAEVITDKNSYKADLYIFSSGSWTQNILKKLGVKIPIQAGKGYKIDVYRKNPIVYPAILMEAKCAITPMRGFSRFAGTMELSGINNKIRKERVEAIARATASYYDGFKITEEEKAKAGFGNRPVSPDGLPYIGKLSNCDNAYIGTGHAMMGYSLAPATGKLLSEMISGKRTSMDISAFLPERFS